MQQFVKFWGIGFLVLVSAAASFSQIQVTFPTDRAVFQRGTNNRGSISIAGSYFDAVDQIQAKVTPIQGGTFKDWTTIQTNPQRGNFLGTLDVAGGWYRLEVRGLRGGAQVGPSASVDHVGMGEVFIVAGQSNAQGVGVDGAPAVPDPADDRVTCVNFENRGSNSTDYPFPQFSRMRGSSNLSPRGQSAWAWGPLGDQLASRLNVPVLFFNAAWSSTQILAWSESAAGRPGPNNFCQSPECVANGQNNYPSGMPYANLRQSLNYYASLLGVRAVLWMQGETDSYPVITSSDDYKQRLKFIIEKSRNDCGKNISWVVSRTSLSYDFNVNQPVTSFQVTNAQAQVVQEMGNVFAGPFTDDLQVPRRDKLHFTADDVGFGQTGHQRHAQAWSDALNGDFFANSQPQSPQGLIPTAISCAGTSNYTLNIAGNEARWSNGQQGNNITVGRGTYYGQVRDGSGNIFLSQPVLVPQPLINPEGSSEFCQGGNVKLVADSPGPITWSTGATSRDITVTTSGTYKVIFRDQAGCNLESSLQVTVNPLPDKPRITALSDTVFCQNNLAGQPATVTLRAPGNARFRWTLNGTTNQVSDQRDFTTANTGRYTLEVFDGKGCKSVVSDPVGVRVNPNPAKPTITTTGKTIFCADESLTLTSSLADSTNYIWSPNVTARTRSVRVNQGGSYTVRVTNRFGCPSVASDPVNVRVNPLPERPSIS
ncbi:MAG: T9SS C-terminal target domain-containing protein, partial [Sphingobacteriaceae bacterium]|nr:T9SS C-terminal target domain-containing protein [Cytophagaceae bacterium]